MEPTIDKPESLTTEMIQQLGNDYLIKNAKKLFHRDIELASQLSCYNQSSSFLDKWLFLAEKYKSLKSNNGDLAQAILGLFQQAFHKEIIFSLNEFSPRVSFITISRGGNSFVDFAPLFIGEQIAWRVAEYALQHYVMQKQLTNDITTEKPPLSEETITKRRYANILKTFLSSQMQNSEHPKFSLMKTCYEQLNQEQLPDIQHMKDMTEQLKETCIEHRDNGIKGLLKFTFLRQPQSYSTICSLFDEDNQLKF